VTSETLKTLAVTSREMENAQDKLHQAQTVTARPFDAKERELIHRAGLLAPGSNVMILAFPFAQTQTVACSLTSSERMHHSPVTVARLRWISTNFPLQKRYFKLYREPVGFPHLLIYCPLQPNPLRLDTRRITTIVTKKVHPSTSICACARRCQIARAHDQTHELSCHYLSCPFVQLTRYCHEDHTTHKKYPPTYSEQELSILAGKQFRVFSIQGCGRIAYISNPRTKRDEP